MAEAELIKRPRRPRAAMVAAHESASRVFSGFDHDSEIMCVTHGQFSLVDALTALLERTGAADVAVSTWSAAAADLAHAERFLLDGRIRSLRFVVDRSFATRQPRYCELLTRTFGADAVRTTLLHAKFAVIRNDAWNVAVRTSMNLNENRRLEYIEVSDDPDVAAFFASLVDEIFASVPPGEMNSYAMPDGDGRMAPPPVVGGRNVGELERTLAQLARLGRLEEVDSARVQMLRSMARVLDDDPSSAALWRQYRETLGELMADDASGSLDADIDALYADEGNSPSS